MLLVAGHPKRRCADDVADVLSVFRVGMHPTANKFEFGIFQHPFDRRQRRPTRLPIERPAGSWKRSTPLARAPNLSEADAKPYIPGRRGLRMHWS